MIDFFGEKVIRGEIVHNNDGSFYKNWTCPRCKRENIERDGSKVVFCESQICKTDKENYWYFLFI